MATIQSINIGASANDNTGDPLRTAFDKQNQNNTALNNSKAELANPSFTTDIIVNNAITVGKGGGSVASNTIFGDSAGQNNISGSNNVFIGQYNGLNNSTGSYNSFIGAATGSSNTTGAYNSFFGYGSGATNLIGSYNSFFGFQSGINSKGNDNSFFGYQAGFFNSTGNYNVFIGESAGNSNTTGGGNSYLGVSAGSIGNRNNCTAIGYNAQTAGDNENQIGSSTTTTYVYGTVQNRSDLRDKADVRDTILGLDFISKLRPVDYKWDMREDYQSKLPVQGELSDDDFKIELDLWYENNKIGNLNNDGSKKRNRFHHGFLAQEVRDLGIDFGGFQDHSLKGGEDVLSIGYDEFIAPMIKAIQELKAEIELLKSTK